MNRSTPPRPDTVQRRLSHRQIAFVRSWAEGLPLAAAWDRYLFVEGGADGRRAHGELQRLLDGLRSLALAHGRRDLAALLRRNPEAMASPTSSQPTLETFSARLPGDFYSEAELLDLYRESQGPADPAGASRRRQRLRERLVDAVQWLADVGARDPEPDDPVDAWLDEPLAARLGNVGIVRLADLRAWIGRHGFHWHRKIDKVGPERAARIVRWWGEHTGTLPPLPAHALMPPQRWLASVEAATPPGLLAGIVPLERFAAPAGRDGSEGSNRAPPQRCKIAAVNDHEAVQAWLRLRLAGSHTWRAYRKEAERFLLWAVMERRKALSSLDGDDCVAYRDFISAPTAAWTGARHVQRWSEAWRPFEGPLSPESARTAITIVRALCEWLVRRHYLDANPWDDVPQRPDAPSMPQLRALSQRQWERVDRWLAALPASAAHRRVCFLIRFAYLTGLRLSELSAAHIAWFRQETIEDDDRVWSMMVLGKRKKWRELPLPDPAVESFREYLTDRGLNADILSNPPSTPVVARLQQNLPLSSARIHEILVDAFRRCADDVALSDTRAADRIRRATTHWLRHTHGSHAAARGVPQDVLQANLGHASLATTSIYVQAEKGRRHRAVQAAFGFKPGRFPTPDP